MNSRNKGAKGELELAEKLRGLGFKTRRGQQYSGANGDADVVGIDGLHIECKRVERLDLDGAMEQSINDARVGEIPVVVCRTKGEDFASVGEGEIAKLLKEFSE